MVLRDLPTFNLDNLIRDHLLFNIPLKTCKKPSEISDLARFLETKKFIETFQKMIDITLVFTRLNSVISLIKLEQ